MYFVVWLRILQVCWDGRRSRRRRQVLDRIQQIIVSTMKNSAGVIVHTKDGYVLPVEKSDCTNIENADRRETVHVDFVTFATVEIQNLKSDAGRRQSDVLQRTEAHVLDLA